MRICEREINIDIATFSKHSFSYSKFGCACVDKISIHCIDCSIHLSNEVKIKNVERGTTQKEGIEERSEERGETGERRSERRARR